MTKRATFTQAELERADRAAVKRGKVVMVMPGGAFALVSADTLPRLDTKPESPKTAGPKKWAKG